jgi:putative transposase
MPPPKRENSYVATGVCPVSTSQPDDDDPGMASSRLLTGRYSQPGAYYVVTTVSVARRPLFAEAAVAAAVVAEIGRDAEETGVESLAWVLMPDHVHWLLQLRDESLSGCLQRFKSRSARAVNALRDGSGAVWQAGFYDHRLRSEQELAMQARYVIANPLRAGLVSRIEDYPYWGCRFIERADDLRL